jgi:hypothetical protein
MCSDACIFYFFIVSKKQMSVPQETLNTVAVVTPVVKPPATHKPPKVIGVSSVYYKPTLTESTVKQKQSENKKRMTPCALKLRIASALAVYKNKMYEIATTELEPSSMFDTMSSINEISVNVENQIYKSISDFFSDTETEEGTQ